MFDDPKRELRRLEEQLLQQDDQWLDDELTQARQLLGDDAPDTPPAGSGHVRNRDSLDVDLARYSEDVRETPPQEKGIRGLLILACLETLGIVGIVVYWLIQLL